MVQPIQYTPQFIKTDVGAIQDKLNARQNQYDTAYAGAMTAEDQFGQYNVHAKDIDLKNKVIGGFRDRVKALVDQYGGDYAAASKQLVKEIVNTKNDKFFKLATERNKLADEQRRIIQQYGPNAIVMKDVLKPDLMDADGNYIKPEDLKSEVLNREQFKEMANREYGYLAKDVQEGNFGQSEVAGLLKRQIRTGITAQQVPETAGKIYNLLKKQRPDLPEDVAQSIAIEEARSYVGDIKHDYQGDPGYTKTNPPPPPASQPNLFTERPSEGAKPISENTRNIRIANSNINNAAAVIKSSKENILKLNSQYSSNINRLKREHPDWPDYLIKERAATFGNQNIPSMIAVENIKLNKAREEYSSNDKIFKDNKVYTNLINNGIKPSEAKSITMKNIDETENVFSSGATFNAPEEGLIASAFSGISGNMKEKDKNGVYINSKNTFDDLELSDKSKYNSFGIKPGAGEAFWVDKSGKEYTLPLSSSRNKHVVSANKQYQAVKKVSNGITGLGLTKINNDGSVTPYGKRRHDGDGLYVYVDYENGKLNKEIINVENGKIKKGTLNDFTKDYTNTVAAMLGVKTDIQPDKVVVQ